MKKHVPGNPLKRLPALLLITGLLVLPALGQAAEAARHSYQLPTGPLANVLQSISAQSGVAINYDPKLVGALKAPELKGSLTVAEALQRALQGSGLEAVPAGNGFAIRSSAAGDTQQLAAVTVQGVRKQAETPQRPVTTIARKTGEELEEQHIEDLQDLQYIVPGLFIQSTDSEDTQLSIRGLGDGGGQSSGESNIGMPSSVAVFVDGIYYPRPGVIRALTDIDYVDVYKGPSGTVFGANATGGAIDIHTKGPSFTPETKGSVSYASRNTTKESASITGPINDTVAYRFNIQHSRTDGAVKNLANQNWIGGNERIGLRNQLLIKPNNKFDLKLNAYYSYEDATTARVYQSVAPGNSVITNAKKYGYTFAAGGRETVLDDVISTHSEQGGASAEATYHFDNGYKFRSLSSFSQYHYSQHLADELAIYNYTGGYNVADNGIAQDFRLESSRGKWFDFLAGVSYTRQKQNTEAHTIYGPNAISGSNANLHIIRFGTLHDEASSVYGRGTFHITDKADFQLGVRETYNERLGKFQRLNKASINTEVREYKVLPSASSSLNYRFTPDWKAYVSYGYGQKAGGINVSSGAAKAAGYNTLLLQPETTRSTEIGFQGAIIPQRLLLSAAVFRTNVVNFQTQAYDTDTQTSYLMNAGNYRSQGIEAGLNFKPIDKLSIGLTGIINDARYTSYPTALCPDEVKTTTGYCDLTGHRVFNAPKRVFTLSSRYSWKQDGFDPYVSGNYSYRSWTYNTVSDSEADRLTGYGLAGFSTGVKFKTQQGQWDASLWVTNAFNKLYYTRLIGSGGVTGYVGDPRTVGVTLKFSDF
jgi:iron complex outermembrane recepter protein